MTKSDEESIHLAKAVLVALRKAGYSVTEIEDQNALEAPLNVIGECHLPVPLLLARSLNWCGR